MQDQQRRSFVISSSSTMPGISSSSVSTTEKAVQIRGILEDLPRGHLLTIGLSGRLLDDRH